MTIETTSKLLRDGGVATTIFGWLTVEKTCAIVGLIVAIAGYLLQRRVTMYRMAREAEEHRLNMAVKRAELERLTGIKNNESL
jgi:hypothetical protein